MPPSVLQYTPTGGAADDAIGELLLAHDAYLRARELREHATLLLALLGVPLAVAAAVPARWPRSLTGPVLLGFAATLILTLGAGIAERAWHRRRAQLVAHVDPRRQPSS